MKSRLTDPGLPAPLAEAAAQAAQPYYDVMQKSGLVVQIHFARRGSKIFFRFFTFFLTPDIWKIYLIAHIMWIGVRG